MATITRRADLDGASGTAFEVQGVLRLDQFAHEVAAAHKWRKVPEVFAVGQASSPNRPYLVYLSRDDADEAEIAAAAEQHTPDDTWMPPAYQALNHEVVDPADLSLDDLVVKVQRGDALTSVEVQAAVRELLLDMAARLGAEG